MAQAPWVPCKHGVRDVFCVDCFREWEGEHLDEATMAVLNIERFASQVERLRDRVRVLESGISHAMDALVNGEMEFAWDVLDRVRKYESSVQAVVTHLTEVLEAPSSNAGIACDTDSGPCACGAWHGATPAETPAPTCANCKGAGRWWDTVRETYTDCRCGAPAARRRDSARQESRRRSRF